MVYLGAECISILILQQNTLFLKSEWSRGVLNVVYMLAKNWNFTIKGKIVSVVLAYVALRETHLFGV